MSPSGSLHGFARCLSVPHDVCCDPVMQFAGESAPVVRPDGGEGEKELEQCKLKLHQQHTGEVSTIAIELIVMGVTTLARSP